MVDCELKTNYLPVSFCCRWDKRLVQNGFLHAFTVGESPKHKMAVPFKEMIQREQRPKHLVLLVNATACSDRLGLTSFHGWSMTSEPKTFCSLCIDARHKSTSDLCNLRIRGFMLSTNLHTLIIYHRFFSGKSVPVLGFVLIKRLVKCKQEDAVIPFPADCFTANLAYCYGFTVVATEEAHLQPCDTERKSSQTISCHSFFFIFETFFLLLHSVSVNDFRKN